MEYRHGPIAIAAPGRVTWQFGEPPEGLADDVAATGRPVRDEHARPDGRTRAAQRVSLARARAKGLDPDPPRNLTRSVVLTS